MTTAPDAMAPRPRSHAPRVALGLLLVTDLWFFLVTLAEDLASGQLDTAVFWLIVSLLLVWRVWRHGRTAWGITVALDLFALAVLVIAAPDVLALAMAGVLLARLAALFAPRTRAWVGVGAGAQRTSAPATAEGSARR